MISSRTTISTTTAAVRILFIRSILLTVFSRLLSIYFLPLLQSCSLGFSQVNPNSITSITTSIAIPSPAAAKLNSSARFNAFSNRFDISQLSRMFGDVDGASCLEADSNVAWMSILALQLPQVAVSFSTVAPHSIQVGTSFLSEMLW